MPAFAALIKHLIRGGQAPPSSTANSGSGASSKPSRLYFRSAEPSGNGYPEEHSYLELVEKGATSTTENHIDGGPHLSSASTEHLNASAAAATNTNAIIKSTNVNVHVSIREA
jgi:hypothetical protein